MLTYHLLSRNTPFVPLYPWPHRQASAATKTIHERLTPGSARAKHSAAMEHEVQITLNSLFSLTRTERLAKIPRIRRSPLRSTNMSHHSGHSLNRRSVAQRWIFLPLCHVALASLLYTPLIGAGQPTGRNHAFALHGHFVNGASVGAARWLNSERRAKFRRTPCIDSSAARSNRGKDKSATSDSRVWAFGSRYGAECDHQLQGFLSARLSNRHKRRAGQ